MKLLAQCNLILSCPAVNSPVQPCQKVHCIDFGSISCKHVDKLEPNYTAAGL